MHLYKNIEINKFILYYKPIILKINVRFVTKYNFFFLFYQIYILTVI